MTKTVRVPDTNIDLEVPDEYGPEEVARHVREFQDWKAKQQPSEIPQVDPYTYHHVDPYAEDSWLTRAGKGLGAFAYGTGRSLATAGDILASAPTTLYNDILAMTGQGVERDPGGKITSSNYADYKAPVTQAYEATVPAKPEGRTYQSIADVGEVAGPAVVEALLTEGTSLARGRTSPLMFPVKAAARTARDVGLGVGGGEVGGEVAARIGGEENRDLGRLLGGATMASTVPALARVTASKMLLSPDSLGKLRKIDAANASLPADAQIPPTIGLIGNKSASALEDVTGRTIFSQDAARAREQQFRGMETGVQQAAEGARGGPATGPITRETIGTEAGTAISKAQDKVTARIKQIQTDLENKVGATSPVGLQNTVRELDDIILNPKQYDTGTIQQARDLRGQILSNMQRPAGAGSKRTRISAGTAGYGATRKTRSKLGRMADRNQRPLEKAVQDRAYGGLTQDMKEAAARQGVDPEDFAHAQTETTRLYNQQSELEKLPGTKGEATTHQKTVGGTDTSVQHLAPLVEHTPDEALKLLADDLELRLRGSTAGGPVRPDLFEPKNLERWRSMSPDRKALLAKNNPDVIQQMDNLADVATMETTRSGRRTRPGTTGSTMGVSMNYAIPGAVGLAKSLAAGIGTLGIPKAVGMLVTSPRFARSLADPQGTISNLLAHAVGGGSAASNIHQTAQEKAQEEEQRRRLMEGGW